LAQAQRAVSVGAANAESANSLALQVKAMEAQLARAAANIDEIKASALPPRDELNAPLVNGRDFVRDRIQYRLMVLQAELQAAENIQAEMARRVRVGAAPETASLDADLSVAKWTRDLAVAAEQLSLRKEFLERGTPVDQLTRRLEQMQLKQDVVIAQKALEVAQQRTALLERRQSAGAADDLDVLKAQVELRERQIELQQLARRLKDSKVP
jgi:outer membrane protein TolC